MTYLDENHMVQNNEDYFASPSLVDKAVRLSVCTETARLPLWTDCNVQKIEDLEDGYVSFEAVLWVSARLTMEQHECYVTAEDEYEATLEAVADIDELADWDVCQ